LVLSVFIGLAIALTQGEAPSKLSSVLQAFADGKMTMSKTAAASKQSSGAAAEPARPRTGFSLLMATDQIGFNVVITEKATVDSVIEQLTAVGATGLAGRGRGISGFIAPARLNVVAQLESVSAVYESHIAFSAGSVQSEGVTATYADLVSQAFLFNCDDPTITVNGEGVTIGVISDSLTCETSVGFGMSQYTSDVPSVEVLSESFDCVKTYFPVFQRHQDEGRAMIEAIHDIAPSAKIKFCSGANGYFRFIDCIYRLQAAGATIIIDNVQYAQEFVYADDDATSAVDYVKSQGVTYVSAAGNNARDAFETETRFVEDTVSFYFGDNVDALTGLYHDFDPSPTGIDYFQRFDTFQDYYNVIYFHVVGKQFLPETRIEILFVLFDAQDRPQFLYSASNIFFPFISISLYSTTDDRLGFAIRSISAPGVPPTPYLYYFAVEGPLINPKYISPSGTIVGHANAAGALTIGAVGAAQSPAFGVDPPVLEAFSSVGGIKVHFDIFGQRFTTPQDRLKPDLSCIDGVSNSFYGLLFGTSAGAAHVAGIAALMLQSRPGLSVDEVYSILKRTSYDFLAPGYDVESGYGLCNAAAAVNAAMNEKIASQKTLGPCAKVSCALHSQTGIIPPLKTTTCRGAASSCDVDEVCSNTSDRCPDDAKKAVGATCNDGNAATTGDICVAGGDCCGFTGAATGVVVLRGKLQSLFVPSPSSPLAANGGVLTCPIVEDVERRRDVKAAFSDDDESTTSHVDLKFSIETVTTSICKLEAIWYIDGEPIARAVAHKSQKLLHFTATKSGRLTPGLHIIRATLNAHDCEAPDFVATSEVNFKN